MAATGLHVPAAPDRSKRSGNEDRDPADNSKAQDDVGAGCDVVSMLGIDDPGLDWPRKALSQAELTAEEGGAGYLRLPRFGDALSVEEGLRRELRDDGLEELGEAEDRGGGGSRGDGVSEGRRWERHGEDNV
ncbi:hypothetical protein LTR12_000698 [Friedmanniomyces endolithicus]|nr:hypothetical protein LTR12_000698 [Friedmanniomyces endolithicus]